MTPGPKKKNSNRQGGDKVFDKRQDNKKNFASNSHTENSSVPPPVVDLISQDADLGQDKKYAKRSVTTNWSKYDEPIIDPHADAMRGRDFEELVSYSGGSESQLRLQDEKGWDDACIEEKSITFDLQDLANAVKCIPFHRRINLPEDVFDESQLARLISSADNWKKSFLSKLDAQPVSSTKKAFIKKTEPIDPGCDIIESYECEEVGDVPTKSFTLEEKTENIIESLASCLSLKSLIQKPVNEPKEFKKSSEAPVDDLDFLLSLGTTKEAVKENKSKQQKQTDVDDWLNNLLDD